MPIAIDSRVHLRGSLGWHGRSTCCSRVAEQHHVVFREVGVGDVLVVFDPRVRAIVHGVDAVEMLQDAQRVLIRGIVPRRAGGANQKVGIQKGVVDGALEGMGLMQPGPFAGLSELPRPPVFSRTSCGAGFTLSSGDRCRSLRRWRCRGVSGE